MSIFTEGAVLRLHGHGNVRRVRLIALEEEEANVVELKGDAPGMGNMLFKRGSIIHGVHK